MLVFGGLFVVDVASQAYGCGSIDATDPNNYSVVQLRNDTTNSVIVRDRRGPIATSIVQLDSTPVNRSSCGAGAGPEGRT